ncbi:MAG TPA: hypothetical protein VKE22_02355 [Haliangiales bacterium]|nr:hypothetical protein [Haliangiales bacterium]
MRALVAEVAWPRRAPARIVLAIVLLKPILMFAVPRLALDEPPEVTAIYRSSGDIQYYELVGPLARGVVGESQIFERAGEGVSPFPVAGVGLHVVGLAALGPWGLMVADAVITYLFFVGAALLFRVCGLSERAAPLLAGAIGSMLVIVLAPLASLLGLEQDLYWWDRFPRPFVTMTYLIWALALIASLWFRRDERRGAGFFVAAGLVLALVVQSSIYTGVDALGIAVVAVMARLATDSPAERRRLVSGVVLAGAAFAAACVPFILQRGGATLDLLRRWGLYAIGRGAALATIAEVPPGSLVFFAGAAIVYAAAMRRAGRPPVLLWPLGAATLLATIAMPLVSAVTARAIQPFHFTEELKHIAFTGGTILLVAAGSTLSWRRPLANVVTAVLVAGMAVAAAGRVVQNTRRTEHPRRTMYDQPSYRAPLAELVRELGGPRYAGARVLATYDHAVQVFWQGFRGGWSYLPDGFISLAPDAELETRYLLFARLVGLTAAELESWLADRAQLVHLPIAKYATNHLHTPAPISDYTPEQAAAIRRRSFVTGFNIVYPASELARIRTRYAALDPAAEPPRRVDIIVLAKDAMWNGHAPPADRFELTYENAVFRVFLARR